MSLPRRLIEHFVLPADGLRATAGEDFVIPGEAPGACADHAPRTPPGVAVLVAAADAMTAGAAVGLALARVRRVPAVVVCVSSRPTAAWAGWRLPAAPAARRVQARLGARGHDVRATGWLAIVRMPGADDDAASARRVLAAAGDVPWVLTLGGPRTAALDALVGEQEVVVVVTRSDGDPRLARLALAGLGGDARACTCAVPPAGHGRRLAAAGVALLPSLRRALEEPMAELS